jgi:hypothetical protein
MALPNGIEITAYPEEHHKTKAFYRRCRTLNDGRKWPEIPDPSCFLLKVRIGGSEAFVLLEVYPVTPKNVYQLACEKGMNYLFNNALYLSYHDEIFWWHTDKGECVTKALTKGIIPEMYLLLYEKHNALETEA